MQQAATELSALKTTLQDLQALKRSAIDVARLIREIKEIDRDIVKLEGELQASGSTKTSEEVQASLSEAGDKM
jgi:DNA repair protein RAD50